MHSTFFSQEIFVTSEKTKLFFLKCENNFLYLTNTHGIYRRWLAKFKKNTKNYQKQKLLFKYVLYITLKFPILVG